MSLKLMGQKKGMTRVFDEKGNVVVCTVIGINPNFVSQVKTVETDGYSAIQVAAEKVSPSKKRNVTKPLVGHYAKAQIEPMKFASECRVEDATSYSMGQELSLELFQDVQFVDVTGVSKGKGFQGVIKRHNFKGGRATHGSSFHRAHGSTGMRSTPGRVFPGKKMAGHMGSERVTVENLQVVRVDLERNCLLVKGAIPGGKNGLVYVRKANKK